MRQSIHGPLRTLVGLAADTFVTVPTPCKKPRNFFSKAPWLLKHFHGQPAELGTSFPHPEQAAVKKILALKKILVRS